MKGKVQDPKKDQDPKGGYAESDKDEETGVDAGEGTPKGMDKAKKSMDGIDQTDLEKSIQRLETYAEEGDAPSRKDALLAKAQQGELTDDERDELYKALGGETTAPEAEDEGEDLTKGLKGNETLQKALDVSDYLAEQHSELCKSLEAVGEVIEKSDKRQHEFNLILAKAMVDSGNLLKAVAEKLDVIGSQPARGPKSAGVQGQPMEKSFGGQPPAGTDLSRNQILDGLDMLMEKSMSEGRDGMSMSGEDILKSVSKYEQTHSISRGMLAEVQEVLKQRAAH